MKKIIFLGLIILLISAGGFFWWQKNQKDVKELNKNLPERIKVTKSFLGKYKVIDKIDGYEFKVPEEWGGLAEIEYTPGRTEGGYSGTSLSIEGNKGAGRVAAIDFYKSGGDIDSDLKLWAESNFRTFGLVGDFTQNRVGTFDAVKTQENIHLGGEYIYFFKEVGNRGVYTITGPSEDFIREIIANGKW